MIDSQTTFEIIFNENLLTHTFWEGNETEELLPFQYFF